MIYKQVSLDEFVQAFKDMGRENNFTYDGLSALYEYLDNYGGDGSTQFELDVIALCCEYTEFDSFEDLQAQYPNIKDLEDLNNHTQVIEIDNAMKTESFIIANF